MIATLINDRTLLTEVSCATWEELVDVAGAPLIEQGSIEPGYLQSIKETVHTYGPYMVLIDDVVLFHGRPDSGVHEVAMSLALLREPVYLGDRRILAAFLFAALDDHSHLELLRELARVLGDDAILNLLRSHGDPREIVSGLQLTEEQR